MSATVSTPTPAAAPSLLTSGEKLFSPAAIAKQIPSHRDKAHLNGATVFRWIVRGVKTANGDVIRLEAVKLGSFWRTSLEAVERFSSKLTSASIQTDTPPAPLAPTPKQRSRAAAKASREADALFGRAGE
ncbi:hypothetical protein [Frigoriglobus tundricola]|uniref:DUF1580 domain-containing protein n=1 Tax=Frigoriglobus tundricola TaxID=2774151 RepID=A0A6M5YIK7_9BACT|nr:hypothetical protein [Frigoriglobus tundricola]QJW93151.1 hypothetical protein FTUN_0656 [Frigoriglobus tundricola]